MTNEEVESSGAHIVKSEALSQCFTVNLFRSDHIRKEWIHFTLLYIFFSSSALGLLNHCLGREYCLHGPALQNWAQKANDAELFMLLIENLKMAVKVYCKGEIQGVEKSVVVAI